MISNARSKASETIEEKLIQSLYEENKHLREQLDYALEFVNKETTFNKKTIDTLKEMLKVKRLNCRSGKYE